MNSGGWLHVTRGDAPLLLSIPHSGTQIPPQMEATLDSAWLARKDTDWWVDTLYDFAPQLGITVVRTAISRTVIDVNRDPSGVALYPGQETTGLCPTTTFDGEPLYRRQAAPDPEQIAARRLDYFDPYHAALAAQIARLRAMHGAIVLYEAHSIRSQVPRLFEGMLPHFNLGTNTGASCARELTRAVESVCSASKFSHVTDGRFKGGYTTRHYGRPREGVHAIQLELACRGYLREPALPLTPENWPPVYDAAHADSMRNTLAGVLRACLDFMSTFSRKRFS